MVRSNITIENARMLFRDFSGEKNRYNNDRTFCVVIEPDLAEKLIADGWPIKWLEPRNEEEERTAILRVKVSFGKIPPQIVIISNGRKQTLDENSVNILDWAYIDNVDVQIRPYNYEVNGKTGVKAYLKSLWVTIRDDSLEAKYKDIPYANEPLIDPDEEDVPFN